MIYKINIHITITCPHPSRILHCVSVSEVADKLSDLLQLEGLLFQRLLIRPQLALHQHQLFPASPPNCQFPPFLNSQIDELLNLPDLLLVALVLIPQQVAFFKQLLVLFERVGDVGLMDILHFLARELHQIELLGDCLALVFQDVVLLVPLLLL